ncbi:MAG: anion-transporting ArsA/GET3 family ATPase [Acidimicrobiales bacterium]
MTTDPVVADSDVAAQQPGDVEGGPADELLATASVLVVIGPGGVGKTTLAAALAARAAKVHGRRALVVTVDPARRLADALGTTDLAEEAVLVPTGSEPGRLWALMVDMGQSWDRLVDRHAPDSETRQQLLNNRLYRMLTQKFTQSHDYIALDRLVDLAEQDEYDLLVIDTPPSGHALGVLDAPDRMIDFFGSRLLTWLTAPYRNRLVRTAATPFLAVAERLLGGPFLDEIAEFFWLFSGLQPGFAQRARAVKARLADPATSYVIVQTTQPQQADRAKELGRAIETRGFSPALVLVNRTPDNRVAIVDQAEIDEIQDPELRLAVERLVADAKLPATDWGPIPIQSVPVADDLTSTHRLIGLLDG